MVTRVEREAERRALGRRVAELRRLRGLTQAALADQLGAGMRYVQLVESGVGNTTFIVLLKLADALGIPVARLFDAPKSTAAPKLGRPVGVVETKTRRRVSPSRPKQTTQGKFRKK